MIVSTLSTSGIITHGHLLCQYFIDFVIVHAYTATPIVCLLNDEFIDLTVLLTSNIFTLILPLTLHSHILTLSNNTHIVFILFVTSFYIAASWWLSTNSLFFDYLTIKITIKDFDNISMATFS